MGLNKRSRFDMRATFLFLLAMSILLSTIHQSSHASSQPGGTGMDFDISIDNHIVEIIQIDDYRIQAHHNKLFFNANNESYDGNINVWVQEDSKITRFGPVVNSSYKGGNYSQIMSTIYQYNLSNNGHVIPANSSFQLYFAYTNDYVSDEFFFEKIFFYSNLFLEVKVYPIEGVEIVSSGIHLDKNEKDNFYYSHDSSIRGLGDKITINFRPEEESKDSSISLFFVYIITIVTVVFIIQKTRSKPEKNRTMTPSPGNHPQESIDVEKEARTEITESSKHETPRMKKIKLDSFMEKKKSLLFAMKILEEENDSGQLSAHEYEKLLKDYRKKTVEILMRIDEYKKLRT